ncbi:LOW QUALITY PROTEIN: uncharacterized protein [Choristoneura fumiferana]|uniref:LOW QUALITY PROTEIN: uncharacterized protein n=1 Tax=Choristoneura fumiferana TaxID=7141 RepID=UPI003D156487
MEAGLYAQTRSVHDVRTLDAKSESLALNNFVASLPYVGTTLEPLTELPQAGDHVACMDTEYPRRYTSWNFQTHSTITNFSMWEAGGAVEVAVQARAPAVFILSDGALDQILRLPITVTAKTRERLLNGTYYLGSTGHIYERLPPRHAYRSTPNPVAEASRIADSIEEAPQQPERQGSRSAFSEYEVLEPVEPAMRSKVELIPTRVVKSQFTGFQSNTPTTLPKSAKSVQLEAYATNVKNRIIISEKVKFYNRDDVSRATAGKKEFKTKGKIKRQKRYLLNTIKELYKKYRTEGGRAKSTAFKKYRPFHVLQPKLSSRETCGCIKHENFSIKVATLNSLGMLKTKNSNEILLNVVCDLESKACAYGECPTCVNKFMKFDEDDRDMNEINDGKTMTTKKMVKKEIQDKLQTLTESFNQELKDIKKHIFNIKHQCAHYLSCIKNLKATEVAIHIDFSENYVCKLATEVQSMHFGASKSQVTIHTGVLYAKEKKPQSFASISTSNEHGPEAIWAHLNPILKYVQRNTRWLMRSIFSPMDQQHSINKKRIFFLFTKCTTEM